MTASPSMAARAGSWFLNSGIQAAHGGVARYHLVDSGRNARVSTEITGYAISSMLFLHGVTGDSRLMAAAFRAGQFLTRVAWDRRAGVFPFEYGTNGDAGEPLAYFFDSGIICRGLLALWRATGEEEFLEGAGRCGVSMARRFAVHGAEIPPVLSLPGCEPLPLENRWSREPGCYQLKSAMAWLEVAEATGDRRFEDFYEQALARALRTHGDFLPGTAEPEKVMDRLHAYCYFLEGLLPRARRPEVRTALADGLSRAAHYLREIAPRFVRSDVYAQLLRARLYADALGAVPLDVKAAKEEAAAIETFQYSHDEARLDGAFCFGRRGEQWLPFANPVSTAFCSQALLLWDRGPRRMAAYAVHDLV